MRVWVGRGRFAVLVGAGRKCDVRCDVQYIQYISIPIARAQTIRHGYPNTHYMSAQESNTAPYAARPASLHASTTALVTGGLLTTMTASTCSVCASQRASNARSGRPALLSKIAAVESMVRIASSAKAQCAAEGSYVHHMTLILRRSVSMREMVGDVRRDSMGPMPAPVATRRSEVNSGAKARKLSVGGRRIQSLVGGDAMMDFVQSPACEMMILHAVEEMGMVAKACHSVQGAVEVRMVDV